MKKAKFLTFSFVLLMSSALTVNALNLSVRAMTSNGVLGGIGISDAGGTIEGGLSIGTSNDGTFWGAYYVFKLPDLQGEVFESASLNLKLTDIRNTPYSADVFGLRVSGSNLINTSDADISGIGLISGFLDRTKNSSGDLVDSGTEEGGLNNWLRDNYVAGEYAVIAIRSKKPNPPVGNIRFMVAGGTDAPLLTINTVVPEPATYALIFGGLTLGFVVLRRRSKG